MIFLQIFFLSIHFIVYNSYMIKNLPNFRKTFFHLSNSGLVFKYSNNVSMKFGGGSIFFILDKYINHLQIYIYMILMIK